MEQAPVPVPGGGRCAAVSQPDEAGPVRVAVRRLTADLPLSGYAHPGDAGADPVAACDVDLASGARAPVPTGVAIALPPGRRGDRIAQLVVQRVERADFHPVEVLPDSSRGVAGHGSTGGQDSPARPAVVGAGDRVGAAQVPAARETR
jgi:dUTP pyrophosphatase